LVDYVKTITNNLIVVGYDPTSRWGTLVWGSDMWRFNGETLQDVGKSIDFGATSMSAAPIKDVEHLNDMGSTLLSESITKGFIRSYNNEISTGYEISTAYLTDSNGYYYIFWGDVTDADERVSAEYTATTSYTAAFTVVTSPSSVWS